MGKTACKMDNDDLKELRSKQHKYKCKKCGETANKEKYLCKPKEL
jgi:tRNA(Ile2) C34 agmatinyltransferase TiaS